MKKRVTIKTYKFINVFVAFLFACILIKMSYIVLAKKVDGVNLKEKSASITTAKKTLFASRGSIYDSSGNTLATTVNSYTLIAYLSDTRTKDMNHPHHVVDKEKTARLLAPILDLEEDKILGYLNKDAYQVEFGPKGKNLTDLTKQKIEELELPGIDFITSNKRYYNMSDFASYIVGYAKEKDGQIKGELGIEGYYDDVLKGKNGHKEYQKYTSGNYQIPNTPSHIVKAVDGKDIYLTLDSSIQLICEKAISEYEKYGVDWAFLTVMDAKTGAIVASATSPNFNPNDTNTIKSYMNPLVSYQYEPGSVMKVFSFASAIEEGIYKGDATYKSGSIEVMDKVVRDANRKGWGEITYDTGFAYSSNVAATKLALELQISKLTDYYNNLGFGAKTGIGLANEVKGIVNIDNQVTLANSSFGQGITVTPIQMLQAMTTMTNDGEVIKPYIVDKIVDGDKTVYKGKRNVVRKVYSKNTVNKMHELMKKVIYEGLTNMWQVNNLEIMGKTGTAQIASPHGGYLDGQYDYIKSFAAIFPANEPKYIVYAATKRLQTKPRNFANVVTKAIEEIAGYSKLIKSEEEKSNNKEIKVENYISLNKNKALEKLNNLGIVPIIIGDGNYIINQFPLSEQTVLKNNKIFLLTNKENYVMPNMTKWSRGEVKTYCNLAKLNCELDGYGYVKEQNIPEGTPINKEEPIKIILE